MRALALLLAAACYRPATARDTVPFDYAWRFQLLPTLKSVEPPSCPSVLSIMDSVMSRN